MSVQISEKNEARLTEEAQRQGMSVDALIERLMSERAATPTTETGAVVLAALEARPYPDIDLTPPRVRLTNARDVVL